MYSDNTSDFIANFDSQAEQDLGHILLKMGREQKIDGVMPHPKIAGVEGDFLIQVGEDIESDFFQTGQVVLLEYDGLKEDRRFSVESKLSRYGRLKRSGMEMRWLFEPTEKEVVSALQEKKNGYRVDKSLHCTNCGHDERIVVMSPDEDVPGYFHSQIQNCKKCK